MITDGQGDLENGQRDIMNLDVYYHHEIPVQIEWMRCGFKRNPVIR